ncbi:ribulose bisphosphate carboxylase small subunit [Sporichthya brevicatena]|uniref:Ribulose bisphosphate carboxylase small subunit n=1 Tax=Sporichthya brevicatena TaxID=171442 RepID=A0ABP3RW25_9ACTN
MRITQGTFSFLPDLTDDEIAAQIQYCLDHGWPLSIEFTDDPHPRNTYWEMWGLPMFDLVDPAGVLLEINACRQARPDCYIRVNAYDASLGRQTTALSILVQRPADETGFRLIRQESSDRRISYTTERLAR